MKAKKRLAKWIRPWAAEFILAGLFPRKIGKTIILDYLWDIEKQED